MDTIRNEAQKAFDKLCNIAVRGADVELLLEVKNHLREIYRLTRQTEEEAST